jgi:N-acetylneuraminic acid mutarotase
MASIAPAARQDHTAVWTGTHMVVWGGYDGSGELNDGGRYDPAGNVWTEVSTASAPAARRYHTAVWTGSEMIVWGGLCYDTTEQRFNDGGRYNPAGDTWTAVATDNAPAARIDHTAVWTGNEMIVWGGSYFGTNVQILKDGGRYDPASGSWAALSTNKAPAARYDHTAVWTGSEMLVWGGMSLDAKWTGDWQYLSDGGRYDPANDTWTTQAPSARNLHTAVWTGSEMIICGGSYFVEGDGEHYLNSGGRYSPAANSWTEVNNIGAPAVRASHTAVWTGSEMIVWGGWYYGTNNQYLNTGGRYSPASDSWSAVSTTNAPAARYFHSAVWTGSEMIVWGGYNGSYLNTGGRYNPANNSWTATSTASAPSARWWHTAVWSGTNMIVWGGAYYDTTTRYLNTGARYNPIANTWAAMSTNSAPAGRWKHTAVWAGTNLIVWGGNAGGALNDGGRYDPTGNSWTALGANSAPSARFLHTAVWTGGEMIVWGGYDGDNSLSDGGRYDPADNNWKLISSSGGPPPRQSHTAVWTGSELIIWGGGGWNGASFGDGYSYTPSRLLYLYQRL